MSEQSYALTADAAEFYESVFVPALFAEWAEQLVAAAGVSAGASVLDVACGTGAVARAAAERVSPGGSVVGLDSNEAMLAVARRRRPDLRWQLGDATDLPFPDGCFDRVLCQAALMFFDDRVAALQEMGRVSAADGTIAVQVPGRLEASQGYSALADVVTAHAGQAARDLLGSYFAVGAPELLSTLFMQAGLVIEEFRTWTGATRLDSLETFLAVELLPIAGSVDMATRDRIVRDCQDALAPFLGPDGAIAAPIEVHLITAHPC